MSFTIFPAIDVRDGRVVRLRQGDYAQETRYAADPLELAKRYADAGAQWLHLVDLDAARAGGFTLRPLLARILANTGLEVQTGGGVRGADDVADLLEAGAARVVVGTVAVRTPEEVRDWLMGFGAEKLTIALDVRQHEDGTWRLPVAGWTEASGRSLDEVLEVFSGSPLRHVLCTDIARDGMLSGPNLDLYRTLRMLAPELELQASGGVRGIDDVIGAHAAGCAGVVLGKALLEGRLDIAEALAC
ncbi:MAG: hisA [Xanthomonadaceae bacterium]|nr:hisA [Xanthomonadaceae bacterium]